MYNVGDKVTYCTEHKTEHGIVKSISDENYVFVVYHCAGEWDRYKDYTGQLTSIQALTIGWV
jgi:hypothetical protein